MAGSSAAPTLVLLLMDRNQHLADWRLVWSKLAPLTAAERDRFARESLQLVRAALIYQRNALEMFEEPELHDLLRLPAASVTTAGDWPPGDDVLFPALMASPGRLPKAGISRDACSRPSARSAGGPSTDWQETAEARRRSADTTKCLLFAMLVLLILATSAEAECACFGVLAVRRRPHRWHADERGAGS